MWSGHVFFNLGTLDNVGASCLIKLHLVADFSGHLRAFRTLNRIDD